MAFTATLGFEEGCTILSYDGANAFNSIYRHSFLPALAEIVPSVVPYGSNLYAREPPKLLFALCMYVSTFICMHVCMCVCMYGHHI